MCTELPVELAEVRPDATALGWVGGRDAGRLIDVSLIMLDGPAVSGDWVVAHAGFALHRISAAAARDALTIHAAATQAPSLPMRANRRSTPIDPKGADMTTDRRTGLLLALATAGISGVAVFLNSYGVRAVGDATAYTTAKNLVAAVVLLAVVACVPGARLTRPTGTRQWWGLAAIGCFGGALAFVLFFEGLAAASSVQAALLHKTLVVWVAVLAVVVLRERMGPWNWAAIGLLLVGQAGLSGGLLTSWGRGETLILIATLLWSVEVVLAKRLLASLSSWTVAVARMAFGAVLLVGWLTVSQGLGGLGGLAASDWAWVIVTGVILAAYVGTWFAALARAAAVDVTAVLVLAVPVTAVLAATIEGRALAPGWLLVTVAGGALAGWLASRTPAAPAGRTLVAMER